MDRSHISIEKLRRANIAEAVEVLAQAYYDNPLPAHAFGKLSRSSRLAKLRRIYRCVLESALVSGHVYIVRRSGAIAGTAVAYSPDQIANPVARSAVHLAAVSSTGLRGAYTYISYAQHIDKLLPTSPHWHLFVVGVAPKFQRQGIGRALVQHFNRVADKDGVPSVLSTGREDQIPFYNALGYAVTNISALSRIDSIVVRVMEREVDAPYPS